MKKRYDVTRQEELAVLFIVFLRKHRGLYEKFKRNMSEHIWKFLLSNNPDLYISEAFEAEDTAQDVQFWQYWHDKWMLEWTNY